MSLFDKVLQPQMVEEHLSPREAVVGILLAAAKADAQLSPVEFARIDQALGSLRLFRNEPPEQVNALAQKMMGIIAAQGPGAIIAQAATLLPPELRATTFVLATDLVLADGQADDAERAFIDNLQMTLKIDEAFALKVVEVMIVKNYG